MRISYHSDVKYTKYIENQFQHSHKATRVTIQNLPPVYARRVTFSWIWCDVPERFDLISMPNGTLQVNLFYSDPNTAEEVIKRANDLIWFPVTPNGKPWIENLRGTEKIIGDNVFMQSHMVPFSDQSLFEMIPPIGKITKLRAFVSN